MSRILAAIMITALTAAAPAAGEDAQLAEFFNAFLQEEIRTRPLEATRLGDHRYDGQLDDLSAEARAGWTARYRATLAELPKKVAFDCLTRAGQIDFEILKHWLTKQLWLAENAKPFEDDPRVYNEYISDSVYILLTQSTLSKAVNVRNAAARLEHIPRVVAAAKANLRHPPRVVLETAIKQNKGSIAFYEGGIYEIAGETPQLSELREPCQRAVASLKDYQSFLEGLLPKATGDWRLGRARFAKKLELELDAGLSADQVLKEADAEFERVLRDMYVLARQLWSGLFPRRPLPPDDAAGRRATVALVLADLSRQHGRADEIVRDARSTVVRIKEFIRANDILRLPEPDRCRIVEMPEFQRGNSVAYLNPAPPLDPRADSVYAVSPPPRDWDARRVESFLQEYNPRMLQILTIHEAYPGHYVQLEYANRHPSLIRKVLYSGVFAEGWAVYTEQMMLDQGFSAGDPVTRLFQLKWYLRAVANAILDHKMHCTEMSDDEALAFLTKGAFQSEGEAVGKIIRAKQTSCQLSTYFVGRTAFCKLRQAVQREQGEAFDLGRYHEAVLDNGTLPVKYLPEVTRERLKRPR